MAGKPRTSPQPQPAPAERRPLPAGLVAVACRQCGGHLVDVIVGATVRCPACLVWTLARPAATRQNGAGGAS
jgi:hypothetical protein